MTVYLVYTGTDLESYMCEMQVGHTYPAGIAGPGWRAMNVAGVGELDDWHCAKLNGSIHIVLSGAVEIGVSAGDLREVVGRPGDAFIYTDTCGRGHWARRNGPDPFTALNIRLGPEWDELKRGFTGWPDNIRPFDGVPVP
jgi:hypothetical protein